MKKSLKKRPLTLLTTKKRNKFNLLFFSFVAAFSIPLVLLAGDIFEKVSFSVFSYAISFLSIFAVLFLLKMIPALKPLIFLSLSLVVAGTILSVYLPDGRYAWLINFSVFPLLAIQLRGSEKGTRWFAGFIILSLVLYFGQKTGFLPPWNIHLTIVEFVSVCIGSFFLFFLSLSAELRQEKLVDRLSDMLVFDDSTGLPNKDVLAHSIDKNKFYIFAIIKIENFSDLVALFGYEFSDTLSLFASQKLRKYEKSFSYKTFQLKYNEYGILVPTQAEMSVVEATQRLSSVLDALAIESLPWEKDRIHLVYRVGGTVICPDDSRNPLSKADVALKKAERGFSVLTIYEEDNTEKESAYQYVIKFTELINNRENNTFRAVFQPVFNSDGTAIEWYEALLRIRKEDGSYTSIFPYLTVARSTGFYQHLTDFILAKAAEAVFDFDVDVSINISIHDIVRPEFLLLIDKAHEKIREKKGRLIFDILESDELVELDKCIWFIDYISRYGFRIAIDDFGTGFSNYSSLVNLPVDIVKIDGSLIKKIRHNDNARILVEGIVHFCKKSNKKTVAEYIENEHVFESVKNMGIDFLQGYYLAKPSAIAAACPL
jgi:EAL domain-containing protein (putative c-di-GMP-specific phosphodiesterase class I)/GGDEF domain-containing protein